ncbi:hypothetical protein [Candidatus Leptofilum sp.]|uniref:hypothetical protein n=1 Tax=Candidatus Leptofilum sp. TaxID=3241576 RepID=UPI003B5903EE
MNLNKIGSLVIILCFSYFLLAGDINTLGSIASIIGIAVLLLQQKEYRNAWRKIMSPFLKHPPTHALDGLLQSFIGAVIFFAALSSIYNRGVFGRLRFIVGNLSIEQMISISDIILVVMSMIFVVNLMIGKGDDDPNL